MLTPMKLLMEFKIKVINAYLLSKVLMKILLIVSIKGIQNITDITEESVSKINDEKSVLHDKKTAF